jgi:hypothetical protein
MRDERGDAPVARSDLNYRPVIHSSNSNLLEVGAGRAGVLDKSFQQRGETLPAVGRNTSSTTPIFRKKTLFAYSPICR